MLWEAEMNMTAGFPGKRLVVETASDHVNISLAFNMNMWNILENSRGVSVLFGGNSIQA